MAQPLACSTKCWSWTITSISAARLPLHQQADRFWKATTSQGMAGCLRSDPLLREQCQQVSGRHANHAPLAGWGGRAGQPRLPATNDVMHS